MRKHTLLSLLAALLVLTLAVPCAFAEEAIDELTLPLTDEPVTLTVWKPWSNDYVSDLNDLQVVKEMEEATGVHIEYITVPTSTATEKYGILLAGDLPDMIWHSNGLAYPGGGEKAIADGVFIDMAPYVEKYMPNYRKLRLADEDTRKITVTDSGKMWGIYMLRCNNALEVVPEPSWVGLVIRQDWLDELNLEKPVTLDDWHTVLTAFKNEKGAEAPLLVTNVGIPKCDYFLSAFGVGSEFYNDNGTVKFGPLEDGYRQYIEMAHQWYTEGLIDPNFISNNVSWNAPADYIATGKAGAGTLSWAATGTSYLEDGRATDPNFYLSAIQGPVMNEGETCQIRNTSYCALTPVSVTTACKYPELAAKWIDYMYTKAGMEATSFGDSTCFTETNGEYAYTDVIMKPASGLSPQSEQFSHILGDGIGMVSWERFNLLNPADRLAAREVYDADGTSLVLPQIELTDEEALTFNSMYTDILTMVQEKTAAYIMGTESMDSYDSFVETLKGLGIEECIALKQAALDRYAAR